MLLAGSPPGTYDAAALQAWTQLRDKVGEVVAFDS